MISWPWDSIVEGFDEDTGFPLYDRSYTAEELREVLMTFFSNGVFTEQADAFAPKAGTGMEITISPGRCFIQGDVGIEDIARTMVFKAASSQDRYDTVVLRWDNNLDARHIELYVKQGTASAKPTRPGLTRGETVWELGICDVFIPAGTTSISQSRITDTRLETARCGSVQPFQTINTTTFFDQIQAEVNRATELAEAAIDGTLYGKLEDMIANGDEALSQRIDGVSQNANNRVAKSGDTMTGNLVIMNTQPGINLRVDEKKRNFIYTGEETGSLIVYNAVKPSTIMSITSEGMPSFAKPVPIPSGGTGAINSSDAASNLGVVKKSGDTMTGTLNITNDSQAGINLKTKDANRFFVYVASANDSLNIYSAESSKGVFRLNSSGDIYISGSVYSALNKLPVIKTGNTSLSVKANSKTSKSITLSNFPDSPRVFVTMYTDTTGIVTANAITLSVTNQSKTGFTINCFCNTSSPGFDTIYVNWMAVEAV